MNTTTLQIPVSSSLRDQAQKQAREMGFSSLQEVVRLFLNQLAQQSIKVQFVPQPPIENLSPSQEAYLNTTTKKVQSDLIKDHIKRLAQSQT